MKQIDILFENDQILVINKPCGIAVQGGEGIAHPLDKELPAQLGYPVYLVHRLDRDTAGLMIVAKSPLYAAQWTKMIGGKLVRKEYTAICAGTMPAKKGTIKTAVIQHGTEKPAVTHYEVLEEKNVSIEEKTVTLSKIHLRLETGRMHQIRIHLAKQNCPIAGDDKHGNFKINKLLRKACGIKQLLLAATSLTFPVDGRDKTISIPCPELFQFQADC